MWWHWGRKKKSIIFNFSDQNTHFALKIDSDVRESFSAAGASRTLRLYCA